VPPKSTCKTVDIKKLMADNGRILTRVGPFISSEMISCSDKNLSTDLTLPCYMDKVRNESWDTVEDWNSKVF
jgi:hypothetical protein